MARRHSEFRPEFHGQKRPADDGLEGEQPLTKKLDRLHIGEKLLRLNGDAPQARPAGTTTLPSTTSQRSSLTADSMLLDDTKDKVYIHDLEKEIADIETEEQDVAFLPEIEKQLNAIPKSVLSEEEKPANNELVLYRLPTSLTVSEDKDSVRRAIADVRRRAREAEPTISPTQSKTQQDFKINLQDVAPDMALGNGDAMDID